MKDMTRLSSLFVLFTALKVDLAGFEPASEISAPALLPS